MIENKYHTYYREKDRITSKLLRSDIFLPFALESLKYQTIFTDAVPMGAPAATDFGRIYINPFDKFYQVENCPFSNILTFVYLHEVGHNIFMHKQRGENKDHELWQYATDFFINLFLFNLESENAIWEKQSNLVKLDIAKYKNQILFDFKFENMIEEEIYSRLMSNGSYTKKTTTQSFKKFLESVGILCDRVSPDDEIKITQSELVYGGKTYKKTNIDFPSIEDFNTSIDKQKSGLDSHLSRSMFENKIKGRGFQNLNFESLIGRLFEVKIPWDTILRDSLLVDLQRSGDISYGKPRISWLCNPTIPYLSNIVEDDCLGTLILTIDESGSMDDDDIGKAISIINQSKSYYKNVYIIKHDTVSTWSKLYEEELTQDAVDDLCVRRHCGGTSHKDAFEKVVEFSKKADTFVSVVLCITDMASDLEETQYILPSSIPRIYLKSGTYQPEGIIGKIIDLGAGQWYAPAGFNRGKI